MISNAENNHVACGVEIAFCPFSPWRSCVLRLFFLILFYLMNALFRNKKNNIYL